MTFSFGRIYPKTPTEYSDNPDKVIAKNLHSPQGSLLWFNYKSPYAVVMSLHWTENRANVLKRNQTKTSSSICQLALLLVGELPGISHISRIVILFLFFTFIGETICYHADCKLILYYFFIDLFLDFI
jgi:hypothetical protein